MKTHALFLMTLLSAGVVLSVFPTAQATERDNRAVVHDERGRIITSTSGNCVRTRWQTESDECYNEPRVAAVERHEISEEERTVYFGFNKITLVESERRKLDSLANTLKSMRDISGVSIVGYADRIGAASANERLSQRRAQVVESYLKEHGYLNTTVAKTSWLGESVPVTDCQKGMKRNALIACLQNDRRVTVELKYESDTSGVITH